MRRAALRWNATPTLTITPSLAWQDGHGNADRPHSDVTFGLRARLKARYDDTFATDRSVIGALLIEDRSDVLDGVTLSSNSSYLDRRNWLSFDVTAFDSPLVKAIVGPGPGGRLFPTPLWDFARMTQLTNGLTGNLFAAARHVGAADTGFGEGEVLPRPAYTLVDASVGVRMRGGPGIDLFVTNLFDVVPVFGQEFTTSPGNTIATSFFSYRVGSPRTVGIRLTKAL